METAEPTSAPAPQAPPPSSAPPTGRQARKLILGLLGVVAALIVVILIWSPAPSLTRTDEPRPSTPVVAPDASRPAADDRPADGTPALGEYVVQEGDTLGDIADTLGTDVDTLLALNELDDPDRLEVGQVLAVPAAPAMVAVAEPEAAPSGQLTYIVAEGDTILSIADELGVDPDDLIAANDLADPDLIVEGEELLIPPQ